MQRTANEYAACERRICKRSDQPKINRITNNDARLILRHVIPLAMIHMRNQFMGFLLCPYMGMGLRLTAFGRRSSAFTYTCIISRQPYYLRRSVSNLEKK